MNIGAQPSSPPRARQGVGKPRAEITLRLNRRRLRLLMLLAIGALLLLSIAGQIAKYRFGLPTGFGLVRLFYVDEENNLPSWYQSAAYLFAAVLLALIALPRWRERAPFARHWAALAAIFLFLSLDESGSLHEGAIEPLQRLVGVPVGALAPTWVIPALIAVAALGLAYLRFMLHLRWPERLQIVLAAALLGGGAVGMEMASAAADLGPQGERKQTFGYALMAHIEEGLEMLGLAVFIDFLLGRLARDRPIRVVVAY